MALVPKLELRQGQQLVMTPQLQQAIRLLQLSNTDLNSFIETELERNPLLERDEASPEPVEAVQPESSEDQKNGDWEAGRLEAPANGATFDNDDEPAGRAANSADYDQGGWASLRSRTSSAFNGEETNLEDFVAAGLSLADYLSEQLHVAIADPAERLIGAHLINMVDEAGYLRGDLDELADRLGAPRSLIDRVLATLQGFEPSGVFARDLGECLALQLKEQNRYDPQIAKLLDNLHLLGSHNLVAL
jgi:RNA polymerase sigma-54 factor